MPDPKPLFSLQNVSYAFNGKTILRDITLNIGALGITGIIGPSGAGKSTLLRLFNRLISQTGGTIAFRGRPLSQIRPRELRRRVGLVAQQPRLFPGTVRDNLAYGPGLVNRKYTDAYYKSLLAAAALGPDYLNLDAEPLSVGEKQRVSLARTLANKPRVLLLDEPTASLDVAGEEKVEQTLKKLTEDDIKIIIVTHSLEQTRRLTGDLVLLKEGALAQTVITAEYFARNDGQAVRAFFRNGAADDGGTDNVREGKPGA